MRKVKFVRRKISVMNRYFVIGIFITILTLPGWAHGENKDFQAFRIAHAGGGLGKTTYTNSYQALSANLQKGFVYFEIDFTYTSDERLVCLHDWEQNFKRTFGFDTDRRLSLEEFEQLVEDNERFDNCTLDGLAKWMQSNPSAFLVTDIRDDNLKALKLIHEVIPDADNRVIPQIYNPGNFRVVSDMGFQQVIWTLYRYSGSGYDVIQWVERWNATVAITMPKERAASALPNALGARGIPTYVHTINKKDEMKMFIDKYGVTEIYTDFLAPEVQ